MIKHPRLKKIGGIQNFFRKTLLRTLLIILIASLAGYLGGHTIQKDFRNLTGYSPEQVMEAPKEESEEVQGGVTLKLIGMAEAVRDKTTEFAYKAIDPPLKAMDWAAFWFSFALCFMGAAWLSGKLINFERQVVTGGVDPAVIENMKTLEAKVKELVDHANQKS